MSGQVAANQNVQGDAPEVEDYVFKNVIPKLGPAGNQDEYPALLPRFGGVAGYDYYQCPVTKQRAAQSDGWKPVRDTNIYAIQGPDGRIDLVLLCRGSRIPGADSTNNKRVLFLDPTIAEITGLDPVTGLPPATKEYDPEPPEADLPEGTAYAEGDAPDLSAAVDATLTTEDTRTDFQKLKEQHAQQ